jgi:hypothetical protein
MFGRNVMIWIADSLRGKVEHHVQRHAVANRIAVNAKLDAELGAELAGDFGRWLIHDFSFQGISDEIAANYMRRHGQATCLRSLPRDIRIAAGTRSARVAWQVTSHSLRLPSNSVASRRTLAQGSAQNGPGR